MASILSGFVSALIEFDEVSVRMVDPNTVEYQILTTGVMPSVVELKTKIWSFLAPPVKRLEVTNIEVVERGIVANRYLVTVRGEMRSKLGLGLRGERFVRR